MAKFTSKKLFVTAAGLEVAFHTVRAKDGPALDDDVKVSVLLRNAPETIRVSCS